MERDRGRCGGCGGRLAATHLLLGTYSLDADGCWRRDLAELIAREDVVVACAACARDAPGDMQRCGDHFRWGPADPA